MISALRVIRWIAGFFMAMQFFGVLNVVMWFQNPGAITREMVGSSIAGFIFLAIFGGIFFGSRILINKLHTKKYGPLQPVPLKGVWTL